MPPSTFITRAYEEIIDFIAAGTTPESPINFQSSEVVKERVADLIFREKTGDLSKVLALSGCIVTNILNTNNVLDKL